MHPLQGGQVFCIQGEILQVLGAKNPHAAGAWSENSSGAACRQARTGCGRTCGGGRDLGGQDRRAGGEPQVLQGQGDGFGQVGQAGLGSAVEGVEGAAKAGETPASQAAGGYGQGHENAAALRGEQVAAVCESLKVVRLEHEENKEKRRAALQELEEVKKAAGAEPVGEAEKGLAAGMRAALAARNIVGKDAEALLADVLQIYLHIKTGGGRGPALHLGQPAGASSQPLASPGAAPPVRVPPTQRRGRGRSLPRLTPVPRSGSASRAPRADRQEEFGISF